MEDGQVGGQIMEDGEVEGQMEVEDGEEGREKEEVGEGEGGEIDGEEKGDGDHTENKYLGSIRQAYIILFKKSCLWKEKNIQIKRERNEIKK